MEASFYTYDRQMTDINVIACIYAWDFWKIFFPYLLFKAMALQLTENDSSFVL